MVQNGKITEADIHFAHGCLVVSILIEMSDGSQVFGGQRLDVNSTIAQGIYLEC